jgi:hypothetical protein
VVVCGRPLNAQQVDCTVKVNYEAIGTSNKDLLQDFERNVRSYINDFQWGSDQIEEKVHCTVDIFVQSVVGENKYMAQVFIGSQRPIYGGNKNTAVVRLFDEAWEFTYVKERPLNHTPYAFNELTSFLDFYIYLILGYDYDTYESLAGTPWFQKASDLTSLGRSTSQKGWQPITSGYSRTQLVTDLLNPTVSAIRVASYHYHFGGLDSLGTDKAKAFANIVKAIDVIGATRKNIDPRNLVFKAFFDTKYMELADILQEYPDRSIYLTLSRIDPYHQMTYEEYRQK